MVRFTGKLRRQPKAVKPKRMSKMEGHHVVSAACNHATSALVTKDGDLYMYGKDTAHADPATGQFRRRSAKGCFIKKTEWNSMHLQYILSIIFCED